MPPPEDGRKARSEAAVVSTSAVVQGLSWGSYYLGYFFRIPYRSSNMRRGSRGEYSRAPGGGRGGSTSSKHK